MPTALEISKACQSGLFVFYGNRIHVTDAQVLYSGVAPLSGCVWVFIKRTGIWEEIPASRVIITTEKAKGAIEMGEKGLASIGDITNYKRSGKRHGEGTTSSPSESQARADAAKKEPRAPKEPKKEAAPKATKEAAKKGGISKKPRGPKAVVSRTLAKQGELPGLKMGTRKIAEIEDLAEKWEDAKLAKKASDEAFQDADDLLVASMRRHERSSYSRTTWGSVSIADPKIHARFKREKGKKE